MSRPTTPLPPSTSPKEPLFTTPGRSSTHPVKPRHHIPHHPHRVHRHHHSHHHHHDKSVPQSAIQPTISNSFGDFLAKTTSGLNDGTKTPPRKNEAAVALKEEEERREKEQQQWKEVERMRTKRAAVDEDLRRTLTTLSTLSTHTTRRLDYTYYSLLSSLSALPSTLTSLHTLCASSTSLFTQFTESTTTLTSELASQVEAADEGFKQQARRIGDLEGRMRKGREKMQALGARLEVVRGKVERNGEREREGSKRVGRWLKVLWGLLGCWGMLALVLMVVRHWPGAGDGLRKANLVELGNRTWSADHKASAIPHLNITKDEADRGRKASRSSSRGCVQTSEAPRQDPILRLFDEL